MTYALPAVVVWFGVIGCIGLSQAAGQKTGATGQVGGAPIRDHRLRIQKHARSWQSIKYENVVVQQSDYSCGAAALATLVRYYWGDPVTEAHFLRAILSFLSPEQLKDRVENGLSMTDLRKAAVKRGYTASMGRISLTELTELRAPVVVRIKKRDYEHFVVYRGLINDRVFLADPMRGNLRLSICEFSQQWPDRAILVVAKPGMELPKDTPLSVRQPLFWVQPELQVVRRALVLDRLIMPRYAIRPPGP